MAKWRYVGWFSHDPMNIDIKPVPVMGLVEAFTKDEAFDKANRFMPTEGRLNWYVREVPPMKRCDKVQKFVTKNGIVEKRCTKEQGHDRRHGFV